MMQRFLILTISWFGLQVTALAEPVVIRAGGYVDVRAGELVSPAEIVVDEGLIRAVNPNQSPEGGDAQEWSHAPFDLHFNLVEEWQCSEVLPDKGDISNAPNHAALLGDILEVTGSPV